MDTQPGQVFTPQGNDPNNETEQQPVVSGVPQQLPTQPVQTAQSAPSEFDEQQTAPNPDQLTQSSELDENDASWAYASNADAVSGLEPLPEDVSWTASEFIEHPKTTRWYAMLGLAGLVLATLDFIFTHDLVSASVIVIAAAMFGVYAGHKPQMRQYRLSPDGLQIGDKMYAYKAYKAFSIAEEGSTVSIVFSPLGRFVPPLTIYVTGDMEDRVLDYLSIFLPIEQRRADAVDGLLRRIRF